MPWPRLWSSSSESKQTDTTTKPLQCTQKPVQDVVQAAEQKTHDLVTTLTPSSDSSILREITKPETLLSTVVLTTICLGGFKLYRTYLRRIPEANNINPSYFRSRSIFGKVTSVGDGDNFRIYHTPGGWLAGWGWLPGRSVPTDRKLLKNNTIHIRIAGIDAPEMAHFGRPAQPHSQESLQWLTSYLLGRRIRAYVYKIDQYSRVVATVYVWKGFLRRDVGLQMLRTGCATVYEAKTGAEFGEGLEDKYRRTERWAKLKRKGMWKNNDNLESPREYKNRYSQSEK